MALNWWASHEQVPRIRRVLKGGGRVGLLMARQPGRGDGCSADGVRADPVGSALTVARLSPTRDAKRDAGCCRSPGSGKGGRGGTAAEAGVRG